MKKKFGIILISVVAIFAIQKYHFPKKVQASATEEEEAADVKTKTEESKPTSSADLKSNSNAEASNVKPQNAIDTRSKEDLAEIQKRRNTAKFALASVYTAMASFHAEYNRYSTDLKSLGFMPMETELPYKLGFIRQYLPPGEMPSASVEDLNSLQNISTDGFIGQAAENPSQIFRYSALLKDVNLETYEKYCQRGCTASADEFELMIVFPLPKTDKVDVWIVNERKEIVQVLDGTK